jgi:hypothetical protein
LAGDFANSQHCLLGHQLFLYEVVMRVFANKSETCVLLGCTVDEEFHKITCKLLILFPEAPFPVSLFEIYDNGTDRFHGSYVIQGQANPNEHRMFKNVTFVEAVF